MCAIRWSIERQEVTKCTYWLAPGSFAQTSCDSLYFWKAGLILERRVGSESLVRALMPFTTSLSSPGGAPLMKEEAIEVEDIVDCVGKLRRGLR